MHGRGLDPARVLAAITRSLKWVGANSYRTSHYPYSDEAMALADKEGFLIIDEIPAVGLLFDDGDKAVETRLAICKQQVSELIARDKNHPSVIMWSVANEPSSRGAMRGNADAGLEFFSELLAHARAQDQARGRRCSSASSAPSAPGWRSRTSSRSTAIGAGTSCRDRSTRPSPSSPASLTSCTPPPASP